MITDSNRIAIIAGEQNITYSELLQHVNVFSKQSPVGRETKTIIFAENSVGWIYAFYSVWANHGTAVPVDASSTASDLAYITGDCKPECIWTTESKMALVREAMNKAGLTPTIRLIEESLSAPTNGNKADITYKEEDTALIIYTSGTTGSPKGVMLSFRNILVNMDAVTNEVPIFNENRRTLILLPLHHVLPLVGTLILPIAGGGGVAICPTMAAADIMETLQRGKIAIMVGVPRLWQSLYGGIKKKIDTNAVTRALFALCAKVNSVGFSRFVFKAVHKKMGGHIKYLVSGGAALDRETAMGLQTLGLELLEGYGMTEAAPMIAFTRPGDLIPNCVGKPLSVMQCKIADGEVCAKGPNIMQGYYNRPEETAAVIDKEGFLHTGDLGRIDKEGRIYITGRSKEIIVLSNGKNVQPNEIEYKLEKYSDHVKEAAVVQDGDLLRAIIVPQEEWAGNMADKEVEEALKRNVIEPYNLTVTNYKKVMSIFVYRGELPRTKLEKLQRFKLKEIIANAKVEEKAEATVQEPTLEEYKIIKRHIETEKHITIRPTDHIETDLAFDSLDMVSLQGFIEATFGTKIDASSMAGYKNILAMAEHIANSKTRMEVEDVDWGKFLNSASSHLDLPSSSCALALLSDISGIVLKAYNRLTIKGQENIPAKGPFIIAPNHQSFADGPAVTAGLSNDILRNTYFYATEEHVQSQWRKSFARHNNIILMKRTSLRDSILRLAEVLKQGKNIIIFPEGARTKDGEIGDFKKTFAILSKELNVPILPVCISGAYEAWPRDRKFITPHKISVEFLPAILPDKKLTYDEISSCVKERICKALDNSKKA